MKLRIDIIPDNDFERQLFKSTIVQQYYLDNLGKKIVVTIVNFFSRYSKVSAEDIYVGIKVSE